MTIGKRWAMALALALRVGRAACRPRRRRRASSARAATSSTSSARPAFNISDARMVRQISGASCVQGSSWGWDRRGVWVTRGCAGVFEVNDYRPVAAARVPAATSCAARAATTSTSSARSGPRVVSATLTRQVSRTACVLGRTWGWRSNGIWVSEGCEGEFRIRTDYRPYPPAPPPGPGVTVCESHEYRYNFCPTGPIRSAQILEQKSQAPCVQGRSWGWRNDGIWVDNGCEAVFRVRAR